MIRTAGRTKDSKMVPFKSLIEATESQFHTFIISKHLYNNYTSYKTNIIMHDLSLR